MKGNCEKVDRKVVAAHEILMQSVPKNATTGQIKRKFKQLALQCHPDKFARTDSKEQRAKAEEFRKLREVYDELVQGSLQRGKVRDGEELGELYGSEDGEFSCERLTEETRESSLLSSVSVTTSRSSECIMRIRSLPGNESDGSFTLSSISLWSIWSRSNESGCLESGNRNKKEGQIRHGEGEMYGNREEMCMENGRGKKKGKLGGNGKAVAWPKKRLNGGEGWENENSKGICMESKCVNEGEVNVGKRKGTDLRKKRNQSQGGVGLRDIWGKWIKEGKARENSQKRERKRMRKRERKRERDRDRNIDKYHDNKRKRIYGKGCRRQNEGKVRQNDYWRKEEHYNWMKGLERLGKRNRNAKRENYPRGRTKWESKGRSQSRKRRKNSPCIPL